MRRPRSGAAAVRRPAGAGRGWSRRELLRLGCLAALAPASCAGPPRPEAELVVNDVHSKLNRTRVGEIVRPGDVRTLREAVLRAAGDRRKLSVAGGRHAMGGQQFGAGTVHLDSRGLDRVLAFDRERGTVEVEAGIQWPALVEALARTQAGAERPWAIVQKQTGADRMTLGGAVASNVHGRGLTLAPIVGEVESLTVVTPAGELVTCAEDREPELFRLVVGGYGLFGVVYSVKLRLARRRKLERLVEVRSAEGLSDAFAARIADGFLYGDFQFMTDATSDGFLDRGVFSCYRPVPDAAARPGRRRRLPRRVWERLIELAHRDKKEAFDLYSRYYLSTSGQLYWSDTHQMTSYLDDYHLALDRRSGASAPGSEMITELYVPRPDLASFLRRAGEVLRELEADVIYGTVRLIETDRVSFLRWARRPWACVVLNLHVDHTADGLRRARDEFRALIDLAVDHGGSFYLTYHRWARRDQLEACYPQMADFLAEKRRRDPHELLESEWYRHLRRLYSL